MPAGKRSSSARKSTEQPPPAEPRRYHAHIGRDAKGHLCFLGYRAGGGTQAGSGVTAVAVVDIGRPFEIRVPSVPPRGKPGLVIEGMAGTNAEPWTPSTILAGARLGWFGFRLIDPNEPGGGT